MNNDHPYLVPALAVGAMIIANNQSNPVMIRRHWARFCKVLTVSPIIMLITTMFGEGFFVNFWVFFAPVALVLSLMHCCTLSYRLNRAQAAFLAQQLAEPITATYTPTQWAQVIADLDPAEERRLDAQLNARKAIETTARG